ncbi:MAG: MarR family transcriptional regulator [bacterium]|nr:MarR family transcriptional regulator [bacterium]
MNDPNQPIMRWVDEFGLYFEESGLPRTAGRILGWLLVANPPEQSASDLTEALKVSKSNISASARMLQQFGLIERVSRPGDRKDYYRMRSDVWANAFLNKVGQFTRMRSLADRGLKLLDAAPDEDKARLNEFREFYAFFEKEVPKLIEMWIRRNEGQS